MWHGREGLGPTSYFPLGIIDNIYQKTVNSWKRDGGRGGTGGGNYSKDGLYTKWHQPLDIKYNNKTWNDNKTNCRKTTKTKIE